MDEKKKIRNWAVLRSFRFWGKKQRFQTTTANWWHHSVLTTIQNGMVVVCKVKSIFSFIYTRCSKRFVKGDCQKSRKFWMAQRASHRLGGLRSRDGQRWREEFYLIGCAFQPFLICQIISYALLRVWSKCNKNIFKLIFTTEGQLRLLVNQYCTTYSVDVGLISLD